jgi:hypothetical protein
MTGAHVGADSISAQCLLGIMAIVILIRKGLSQKDGNKKREGRPERVSLHAFLP